MECNKDEALRAKLIAEEKLTRSDFLGAKKFAMKAQTLYPDLEGISQMQTALDVYLSAENKVKGERDWYAVLGVNPSADDESIKRQYRKYALLLHPDKNKSIGADGAFKLISEAFSFLSDKQKRWAYNQRRGAQVFQQRGAMHAGESGHGAPVQSSGPMFHQRAPFHMGSSGFHRRPPPHMGGSGPNQRAHVPTSGPSAPMPTNGSVPSRPNGSFIFGGRNASASKSEGSSSKRAEPPQNPTTAQSSHQGPETFWTVCQRCKIHYEYLKEYLDRTLLCQSCKQPFAAKEMPPPSNAKLPNASPKKQQHLASNDQKVPNSGKNEAAAKKPAPHLPQGSSSSSKYPPPHYRQDPLPGMGSVSSTDPYIAAKAASVVREAYNKLKRSYTEMHASKDFNPSAASNEFVKHRKVDANNSSYGVGADADANARGNVSFGAASRAANGPSFHGFSGPYGQPSIARDWTPMEIKKTLIAKAQKEIHDKLNQWKAENAAKSAPKVKEKAKSTDKERPKKADNVKVHQQNGNGDSSGTTRIVDQPKKGAINNPSDDDDDDEEEEINEDAQDASMTVPDPDFHDFDQDRTERTFADNEVWAAYDDDDGMPRFYALIGKVISRDPFKLKISWLNSKTNSEFSSMDWVASGFYKTCGEFRVGKYETCKNINSFSQRVHWVKGPRGSILILPKKGDVWALYKNWSAAWDEHTPDEVIHDYEMATVLEDYSEEKGVAVAPLVKVAGFKTVFRQNSDKEAMKVIPKEEIFRLSHRVPYHVLTGYEAPNAPKGFVELDPAATPLELLKVITEETDDPMDQENGNLK